MTYSVKDTKKVKVPIVQNIKNTWNGARLFTRNLVAGAEAVAWIILIITGGTIVYRTLKGDLALNDFVMFAVAFATVAVAFRAAYEFVAYLNKQGARYER
jgi:hypothetical protein